MNQRTDENHWRSYAESGAMVGDVLDEILALLPPPAATGATPRTGLRDFIENGSSARPEDTHHALQDLDQLERELAEAKAELSTWIRRADKTWHEKNFVDRAERAEARVREFEAQPPSAAAPVYDAVADAVTEIADAAHKAFMDFHGFDAGCWDSDNIVQDVKRGLVSAIEELAKRSAAPQSATFTPRGMIDALRQARQYLHEHGKPTLAGDCGTCAEVIAELSGTTDDSSASAPVDSRGAKP